jgi:cob(I)alamin adenosyltransferase
MNANPDKLNAEYGLYKKLQKWCKQIRRDLKRLQAALLEIKDPLGNVQAMVTNKKTLWTSESHRANVSVRPRIR